MQASDLVLLVPSAPSIRAVSDASLSQRTVIRRRASITRREGAAKP